MTIISENLINVVHFARSIVLGHHSILKVNWESFRGRHEEKWGSFRGRYHFGVNKLEIISRSESPSKITKHMVFFLFAPGAKVSLCTMMTDECIIFYAVVPIHS